MRITIDNLIHKYIDFVSLNNINLEVREGELIALLGPSGCGKTTLLKAIAGLTDVCSGKILLGDTEITNLAPQQRKIALVFQNYAFSCYERWRHSSSSTFCRSLLTSRK